MANKVQKVEGGYMFFCDGCGHSHMFYTDPGQKAQWEFNGDLENPTFSPSLINRSTPIKGDPHVCHLFVRDGVIEYLSDCTHSFAGKTVTMEDVEPWGTQ